MRVFVGKCSEWARRGRPALWQAAGMCNRGPPIPYKTHRSRERGNRTKTTFRGHRVGSSISAPLPLWVCGCNSRWQFFAPARPSCCRLSCANRIFMFRFWPAGTALARVAGCGPRVGRCGPELARPCRTIACPVKCNPGPGANRVIQLFCIIFGVSLKKHCTMLWQQN